MSSVCPVLFGTEIFSGASFRLNCRHFDLVVQAMVCNPVASTMEQLIVRISISKKNRTSKMPENNEIVGLEDDKYVLKL